MSQQPGPENPIALESPASIAIIGGGPIGLEAALYGRFLGYQVTLLEQGQVANHVADWQHVTMFTPFSMLHSTLARRALLTQNPDHEFPDDNALISGQQWRERYLLPLANSDLVAKGLKTGCRVLSVARSRYRKHREIGTRNRLETAFTVVWEDKDGNELSDEFDFVLDASGSYGQVGAMGPGGTPALGERQLRSECVNDHELSERIQWRVPEFHDPAVWKQQRVLVLGDGYSAATSVARLSECETQQVVWLSDQSVGEEGPLPALDQDPLPARKQLAEKVNAIGRQNRHTEVMPEQKGFQFVSNSNVTRIHWNREQQVFDVTIRTWQAMDWNQVDWDAEVDLEQPDDVDVEAQFDRVIVNIGYLADWSILRELQLHQCYATEGPMALASHLVAGAAADCLQVDQGGCGTLLTTEPRFFVLGIKSYGRMSQFLYQHGLDQVRDVYRWIVGRSDLDLYRRSL